MASNPNPLATSSVPTKPEIIFSTDLYSLPYCHSVLLSPRLGVFLSPFLLEMPSFSSRILLNSSI